MGQALIWAVAAFLGGGVLLLERRCLGQIALVQPLVLCPIAGLLSGQVEAGIWIGLSLQLLAQGPARDADWALAGVAATLALLLAPQLPLVLVPGNPASLVAVALPALAAIVARGIERGQARRDGDALKRSSPWDDPAPDRALERLVRRRMLRGLLLGGAETAVVGGLVVAAVYAVGHLEPARPIWRSLIGVAVPALGATAALTALARHRLVALSGLSLAGWWAYTVLL